MKLIIWDYHVEPYELYEVVVGIRPSAGIFDRERVLIRMLERLSWYDLVKILGLEYLKENVSTDIIKKIRFIDLRERYEFIRKVLQGEPVSFTGWSDEYREKIRHSLLSNRWYRAEQTLL